MPTQVQFRRGTTTQNNLFTGAAGEVSIDTDKDALRIHDGLVPGGFEQAKADLTNVSGAVNLNLSGITTTNSLSIGSTQVISSARQLQNIASLDAITTATIESAVAAAPNDFTSLNISGLSTFSGITTHTTSLFGTQASFSGVITATSFVGNGSGLTGAGSTVADDTSTNDTFYPVLTQTTSGTITSSKVSTTKLSFNPSTGALSATTFVGALTGTATSTTNIPNLTGDITSANTATTLATVNSNVGTFGSGGTIPTITVNAKGLITGVTTTAVTSGTTITDDTSTDATRYLTFTSATSGSISAANVSSTKLTFNPSTGALSATDFNSTSDINLKENVKIIEYPIDKITKLNGVTFNWKENQKPSIGVIAQEVEKVFPELVKEHGDNKSLNYNGLIGVLIEAVKEQQKQIEELKAIIKNQ